MDSGIDVVDANNFYVDRQLETGSPVPTDPRPALPRPTRSASQRPWLHGFKSPTCTLYRLHRFYVQGDYQRCKEAIDNILESSVEMLCEEHLVMRAKIEREESRIRESAYWLDRALRHNPRSVRALVELGKTYYLLAEHEQAIDLFSKALGLSPENWEIYYWLALATYHASKPPKSIEKAKEVLLSSQGTSMGAEMLALLARLFGEQQQVVPAVEAYKKGAEMEPENVELSYKLGMLYLKARSEEKAFAALGKCMTYDPTYVPGVLAIASILQTHGDYDVALNKYRLAASGFDHSGALWNNIGICYFGKGKLIAAVACLLRANYLCPTDWRVLFNLALVYHALRQFASAFHFISAAFAVCPQNALVLMGMAIILSELDDFTNARAAYKRAVSLDPALSIVKLNHAIFEYRRGNVAAAMELLQGLEPSKPPIPAFDSALERLRTSLDSLEIEKAAKPEDSTE